MVKPLSMEMRHCLTWELYIIFVARNTVVSIMKPRVNWTDMYKATEDEGATNFSISRHTGDDLLPK